MNDVMTRTPTTITGPLTAEALAALQPGDRFELTTEPVTTQQLVRYAGASDDYNRIHYDQPYAVEVGLGGVIAHGMLTMAFMGRAVSAVAGPRGRIRRLSARFTSPVRPGDAVHVVGTVSQVQAASPMGELQCRIDVDVGGRAVANGEATLLIPSGD
jgi:acyl dehydratase